MEKYTKAQMEVIEFEAEDVITTSSIKIEIKEHHKHRKGQCKPKRLI